jgi:signal transduction histidine kinase
VNRLVRRLLQASLQRRSSRWRTANWFLAVGGPVLIATALVPIRSSAGLASVLVWTLLLVVITAAIGGVRPALTCAVIGFSAGDFFFTPPYDTLGIHASADWVALVAFVVVGAIVGTAIGVLIDQLARLANEQAALRRVATLVAQAAPPDELLAAVCRAAGEVLAVDIITMQRYGADGAITVLANWDKSGAHMALGTRYTLGGHNISTLVAQTGAPARMDSYADSSGPLAAVVRGTTARSAVGTPITLEGRPWGIMIASSSREGSLPPDAEVRLAAFTDLVATAIANAESREEIAASRARVVASADEARRRLERDLHDGAQQRLISLGLELRLAQAMAPAELSELNAQLALATKSVNDVGEELREISRGVHPAILSRGGIGSAIKMLARRSAIPVELELRAGQRLPDWLEVAAFYVVSEALTNAAKHSQASLVHIDFDVVDSVVQLSIRDDGVGGVDPTRGSGLTGLRDRVEAFGGTIEIASAAATGTCLHVTIPVGRR